LAFDKREGVFLANDYASSQGCPPNIPSLAHTGPTVKVNEPLSVAAQSVLLRGIDGVFQGRHVVGPFFQTASPLYLGGFLTGLARFDCGLDSNASQAAADKRHTNISRRQVQPNHVLYRVAGLYFSRPGGWHLDCLILGNVYPLDVAALGNLPYDLARNALTLLFATLNVAGYFLGLLNNALDPAGRI
jgi:hypothetical protein